MTKRSVISQIDEKTKQQTVILADHTYIHEELAYTVIVSIAALGSAAKSYVSLTTPATSVKNIHFRPLGGSTTDSGIVFKFFENLSFTSGTLYTPFNRSRASVNTSTVVVKTGVTATPTTELVIAAAGAGAGGNPVTSTGGSAVGSEQEIILLPETDYVLEIENIGAVATNIVITLYWYEEDN